MRHDGAAARSGEASQLRLRLAQHDPLGNVGLHRPRRYRLRACHRHLPLSDGSQSPMADRRASARSSARYAADRGDDCERHSQLFPEAMGTQRRARAHSDRHGRDDRGRTPSPRHSRLRVPGAERVVGHQCLRLDRVVPPRASHDAPFDGRRRYCGAGGLDVHPPRRCRPALY